MLNVLLAVAIAQIVPTPAPLAATPASLGLHADQSATVTITGATGVLTVSSGPLVTASIDPATQSLTVTAAQTLGRDDVRLTDATGAAIDIPVLIAVDAGSMPQSIVLQVTGAPIDPAWLSRRIDAAIRSKAVVQPGASLTLTPPAVSPPLPGATASVPVQLQIAGNGTYLDVASATNVTVRNVAVEPFAPPALLYDDDPEHIDADGVVYRGTVGAEAPARLYYYHDNASDRRRLVVVLSAGNDASSVQIIDASAGPNIDVMSVGHAVSRDFLQMKPRNEGVIYDVGANASLVLHDLSMGSRDGIAGTLGLNVLRGGPLSVTILAVSPGVDPLTMLGGALLPRDGHHRTGIFSLNNFGTHSLAFSAGGPDASIVYADRDVSPPNADPGGTGHDYGDYGVMHTFLFSLSNPGADAANVYLYERPIGGIVRSTFIVDGRTVEMGCVRLNTTRYQIAAFTLAPNSRYQMNVQTMTDGGSNYPLEVGLTTTAPQPTTPPISAPEGCFPK